MRCYIASKFENKLAVRLAMAQLTAAGHEITFDWTQGGLDEFSLENLERSARCDFRGIAEADAFLLLGHVGMMGAFVELGMAIALQKQIFVNERDLCENVFFHLPESEAKISFFHCVEEAVVAITKADQ